MQTYNARWYHAQSRVCHVLERSIQALVVMPVCASYRLVLKVIFECLADIDVMIRMVRCGSLWFEAEKRGDLAAAM